jgi:hypothetical protein
MGNMETFCGPRSKSEFGATIGGFEDEIARNASIVKERQNANLTAKSFQEFMTKRGKIQIVEESEVLSSDTIRSIHNYREEWTYINLHLDWQYSIKLRRKNLDNIPKYAELFMNDIDRTLDMTNYALEEILTYHSVEEEEYARSLGEHGDKVLMDTLIAAYIWRYYDFKSGDCPKVLSKDKFIYALNVQIRIADRSEVILKKLRSTIRAPRNLRDRNDLIQLWLGEEMMKETMIRWEDYLLTSLNRELISDPQVAKSMDSLKSTIEIYS